MLEYQQFAASALQPAAKGMLTQLTPHLLMLPHLAST